MSKVRHPKVVAANDLLEGDAVWLDAEGVWVRDIREAEVIWDDARAEALLKAAEKQTLKVVGRLPRGGASRPGRRAPRPFPRGVPHARPSNYFHGKQATGA